MFSRNINKNIKNEYIDNEIDLISIFSTLYRNKKGILRLSFYGIFISICFLLFSKKVWQGEFQIVLEDDTKQSMPVNSNLAQLAGVTDQVDFLNTEVGILKSPSVLMDIFQDLKNKKIMKKNYSMKRMRFKEWQGKFLDIELEKNTSILNIYYRDSDKNLILPVLNKIYKNYQLYSGKRRLREIKLEEDFLSEQIKLFSNKSINSLKKAQQFAIEEDLSVLKGETEIDTEIPNAINIEAIRIEASNQIRNIDYQLQELEKIGEDSESLMYIGRSIPGLVEQGLPAELDKIDRSLIRLKNLKEQLNDLGDDPVKLQYLGIQIPQLKESGLPQSLKKIETEISLKRVTYKDEDKSIKDLKKRRDILIEIYKRQALGYLNAEIKKLQISKPKLILLLKSKSKSFLLANKIAAESLLKEAERPKGVVIKYRQLLNNAYKDKATLDKLEDQYRSVLLEKARTKDPWQLITTPTLLPEPVSPKILFVLTYGFLLGTFLGSIYVLIKDKKSGLIFERNDVENLFNYPIIAQLSFIKKSKWKESLLPINNDPLIGNNDKISFLFLGQDDNNVFNQLSSELKKELGKIKYSITKDLSSSITNDNFILIIALGITKFEDLQETCEKLSLIKKSVKGVILIQDFIINKDQKNYDEIEEIIMKLKIFYNFSKKS